MKFKIEKNIEMPSPERKKGPGRGKTIFKIPYEIYFLRGKWPVKIMNINSEWEKIIGIQIGNWFFGCVKGKVIKDSSPIIN